MMSKEGNKHDSKFINTLRFKKNCKMNGGRSYKQLGTKLLEII